MESFVAFHLAPFSASFQIANDSTIQQDKPGRGGCVGFAGQPQASPGGSPARKSSTATCTVEGL